MSYWKIYEMALWKGKSYDKYNYPRIIVRQVSKSQNKKYYKHKTMFIFTGDEDQCGARSIVLRQSKSYAKLQPKKSNEIRPIPTQVSFHNIEKATRRKDGRLLQWWFVNPDTFVLVDISGLTSFLDYWYTHQSGKGNQFPHFLSGLARFPDYQSPD